LSGRLPRLGLIVPSGNAVVETDLQRAFAGAATVHATRMDAGTDCTPEAHASMNEGIVAAAGLIGAVHPDFVAYACTSGGFENGVDGDRLIVETVAGVAGAAAVSATGAILESLAALGARRLRVASPYLGSLTEELAALLRGEGFEVVGAESRGHVLNDDIGAETPEEIAGFALAALEPGLDAVVLPCTNWRAFEAAAEIERRSGVAVVTSNLALAAAASRRLGIPATGGLRALAA